MRVLVFWHRKPMKTLLLCNWEKKKKTDAKTLTWLHILFSDGCFTFQQHPEDVNMLWITIQKLLNQWGDQCSAIEPFVTSPEKPVLNTVLFPSHSPSEVTSPPMVFPSDEYSTCLSSCNWWLAQPADLLIHQRSLCPEAPLCSCTVLSSLGSTLNI